MHVLFLLCLCHLTRLHPGLQEEDGLAKDLSQGANEACPSNELLPDPATSDRSTDSEDEEEVPAKQAADTDMQAAMLTHLHPHTNGHLDPGVEAHQSSDDDGEQDTEDEQDDNAAHDEVEHRMVVCLIL